jgi:inward rectifier potassium channel
LSSNELSPNESDETPCERRIIFNGRPLIIRGAYASRWRDIYFFFLTARWPVMLAVVCSFYILMNFIFAGLYLLGGDCILNARPGSVWDAFFFSVQTWATIGYGAMAPKTHYADILVGIESFSGIFSMSLLTGLVFSKFARPKSKVRFTNKILISKFDGQDVLVLRLGNMRSNQIVEAQIRVVFSSEMLTKEGQNFRKLIDLNLMRNSNALFSLTWQVMHVIDESSPFYGMNAAECARKKVQIIVSMMGTDEEFNQTVHARKIYSAADLEWGKRFQDVLDLNGPIPVIDYTKFDDYIPFLSSSTTTVRDSGGV